MTHAEANSPRVLSDVTAGRIIISLSGAVKTIIAASAAGIRTCAVSKYFTLCGIHNS